MPIFDYPQQPGQPQQPSGFYPLTEEQLRYIQNWLLQNQSSAASDPYTTSNVTETRTLDASTATATDVANVLGTLLDDLQSKRTIT